MNYVKLEKSGLDVSSIALGCWAFGGGDYWGNKDNDEVSLRTIDSALDLGINFFDTAETYGVDGHADRVLGRAMKGRREKFVVASKVYLDHMREADVIASCEGTLRRLETDYLDLFYPHFPSKDVPFAETFGALEKLKEQGKIRSVGMCNFGLGAMARMEEEGFLNGVELHQLPYSLLWRTIEFGVQEKTIEKGLKIICYSTLSQGLLTGRVSGTDEMPKNLQCSRHYSGSRPGVGHGEAGCEAEVTKAIGELKTLCRDHGLDLAPAALAWVFAQSGVGCILTGAETPEELQENIRCLDVVLSPEVVAEMSDITKPVKAALGGNMDMWFSGEEARCW